VCHFRGLVRRIAKLRAAGCVCSRLLEEFHPTFSEGDMNYPKNQIPAWAQDVNSAAIQAIVVVSRSMKSWK